jgi:hypothetical protein
LYFRFHLSFCDVQDLLSERRIVVSHEAIRQWCTKSGQTYAAGLRRRGPRLGDKWHPNEVLLNTRGKRHWLWRAGRRRGRCRECRAHPFDGLAGVGGHHFLKASVRAQNLARLHLDIRCRAVEAGRSLVDQNSRVGSADRLTDIAGNGLFSATSQRTLGTRPSQRIFT